MSLLTLFIILFSSNGYALCSCERVSLSLGLSHSNHIFEARVLSGSNSNIVLKEVKVYKGSFITNLKLGNGPCPPKFEVGEDYVFYLKEGKVESQCDQYFKVKEKGLYQQFLKNIALYGPLKK